MNMFNKTDHYIDLHIQYPFCDIRKIINSCDNILPLPNWEIPIEKRHFIQYFGHMEKRRPGFPQIFSDENFYIKGKGGIKFEALENVDLKKPKCIYRKLLNDRLCGARYELGLSFKYEEVFYRFNNSFYKMYESLIRQILLSIPVKFKHINKLSKKENNLLNAGKKITSLYRKATSIKITKSEKLKKIKHGNLCLLFEIPQRYTNLPKISRAETIHFSSDVSLSYNTFNINGELIPVFFLFGKTAHNIELIRKIRIITLRMHFEYQNLRLLLNFAQNPNYKFDHEVFDKYLMQKVRYFNKSETSTIERGEIYEFIFSIFELIAPSEIELLSKNIESIRLQIRNQLLKLISKDQIKSEARFGSKTKNEIRDAIIKGDIKEALNILNRVSKSKEVALINFRYNEYLKNENLGIIGRNEKEIALNQIVFSILTIIDEMKELIDSRQTGIFSNEVKENIQYPH